MSATKKSQATTEEVTDQMNNVTLNEQGTQLTNGHLEAAKAGAEKTEQSEAKPEKKTKQDKDKRRFKYEQWTRPVKNNPVKPEDRVKLTEEHKRIIKQTWDEHIQEQMTVYGVKIFQQIFKLNPKMVGIFEFGQQLVDSDEWTTDKNVTRHPRQFMESIEAAVHCLHDMDNLVAPVFLNLGKHHIYFTGLEEKYFDTFSGSMMYVWREMFGAESFTAEVRAAWSRLFDYMLQHLKGGFIQAVKQKEKKAAKATKK